MFPGFHLNYILLVWSGQTSDAPGGFQSNNTPFERQIWFVT